MSALTAMLEVVLLAVDGHVVESTQQTACVCAAPIATAASVAVVAPDSGLFESRHGCVQCGGLTR